MDEFGEVELRGMLEEAIAEALELADELATLVAAAGLHPEIARVAANYMQARTLVRRLRGVIALEAVGA